MTIFPLSGAGSLPFRSWDEALQFVETYCPEFPYLPELPNVSADNYLIMRPLAGVSTARYCGNGQVELSAPSITALLDSLRNETVSSALQVQIESFLQRFRSAPRVKLQSVGPVTLCENLFWNGEPVSRDREVHQIVLEYYSRWHTNFLSLCQVPGRRTLIFLDEPMLGVLPVDAAGRARGEAVLRERIEHCRRSGQIPAIHCCAPVAEGSSLLWEADGLSFDALLSPLSVVLSKLNSTSLSVMNLGLGLVQPKAPEMKELDVIVEDIFSQLSDSANSSLSLERVFLTPACGLALVSEAQCHQTYQLLQLLQAKLRARFSAT